MPTYTNHRESSSHRRKEWQVLTLVLGVAFWTCLAARGGEFAQPPEWTDEVQGVFFDDARQALSGSPPTVASDPVFASADRQLGRSSDAIWRELITPAALESAVKASIIRVGLSVKQPARFKAGLHSDCRRELTLLGTLFGVIANYPNNIRWKAIAPRLEQMCLHSAESCARGTDQSLAMANETLTVLEEVLRGQATIETPLSKDSLSPDFAPLMQYMERVLQDELPEDLGRQPQFRMRALVVSERAQMLAMLSQVIRREEYGYADDDAYQAHADKLRDAAKQLNEAAAGEDFQAAVKATADMGKACSACHADYRG
jgi:cytochrome c556